MVASYGRAAFVALAIGLMTVVGANVASAQMASDILKERSKLMKGLGGNMKAIGAFLKKGEGSAADVGKRARQIAAMAARIPDLYPKGTSMNDGVGKTRAKPEIWTQRVAFEAASAKLSELAWNMSAAAATGNKGAIGKAMGPMGKVGCGGCHKVFRGPKIK